MRRVVVIFSLDVSWSTTGDDLKTLLVHSQSRIRLHTGTGCYNRWSFCTAIDVSGEDVGTRHLHREFIGTLVAALSSQLITSQSTSAVMMLMHLFHHNKQLQFVTVAARKENQIRRVVCHCYINVWLWAIVHEISSIIWTVLVLWAV